MERMGVGWGEGEGAAEAEVVEGADAAFKVDKGVEALRTAVAGYNDRIDSSRQNF